MKLVTVALAACTAVIASGMSGCGDIQLKSGWYACTTSDDCPRGLLCDPISAEERRCFPPGWWLDACAGRECGLSKGMYCGTCGGATPYCDATGQCVDPTALSWVSIPGGSFSMGSTSGGSDEQPVHTVAVPAFEMTMTEVTVEQYGACVTSGPCTNPPTGGNCNWSASGNEDHPVNCVVWQQAVDFCAWVGGRLPSEAEWEYAARSGGQDITYPWGNVPASCSYAVMDDGGDGCGTGRTMSACSKVAGSTSQRLCDMAGNVMEWVQDWYHSDYTGAPTDGSAWESPSGSYRVRRGGSFVIGAYYLRAAIRFDGYPSDRDASVGFRCAR